jgi:molybdopterin-containing oxidoreductase family molybdopterin binding subunit
MATEKITYNACQGWGCHEHCILTTHVQDGKIVRTERTILKGSQAERYGICQRGIMAGRLPYLPERVLYPMKRVGERGEGKFQRIPWEQALDEIGAKLNEIRDTYGSRAVIVNPFPCGYPLLYGGLGTSLSYRFIESFDASKLEDEGVDKGGINLANMEWGGVWARPMATDLAIMEGSKYIIIWGGNPIGWTRAAATSRIFMSAQEKGAKIVDIGLIYDSTAAKADEFIPVKAGTDAALALAMANVLISENLYDEDFLIKHTVAPFLVREDNGKWLRESDIVEGGDPKKYVVWSQVPGKPVGIAPHTFEFDGVYPDLSSERTVGGIRCKTAFAQLRERVAMWTPESQEPVTGVPAQTARRIAHEYVENKPASIYMYYGLRYMNGTATSRAIALLSALSGNLGLPNGRFFAGNMPDGQPAALNDAAVMFPEGPQNAKGRPLFMIDLLDALETGNAQQYKAFINTMGNPVLNWPNRRLWTEQIFPKMELVVAFEIRNTDTTAFADYVLPEATIFEREEIICPIGGCAILNEPAIEPLGESEPPADIWRGLAQRVGLTEAFNKTTEDWLAMRLQTPDPAVAEVKPPLTLRRLQQEKIVKLNVPDETFDGWKDLDLPTRSGRVEFYVEDLAEVDGALASYIEPQIHNPRLTQKYKLQFFPGRHRFYMQGQFSEIPELRALAGKVSVVALNPADAKERGISQNDWVEVFNDRGSVRARAHLSEMFPPGMAHLWYSYPSKYYPTNPPTMLSTSICSREAEDAIAKAWGPAFRKAQSEAGMPATLIFNPGETTNETFWDDLCDVRKVEGGK